MAAAHSVIHGEDFDRLGGDARRMAEDVGDHVHGPPIPQHFVRLRVADRENVILRHGLEALTL